MSYYRQRFNNFEEFKREALTHDRAGHSGSLGKEEYELLEEIEADENFHYRPRRRRSSWFD